MPTNRPRPDETREMRLFGKVIELSESVVDTSLPEFIARRRQPGADWRTWDEVRYELTEVCGEIVTDQTIRGWAKRYGIPEDTERDGQSGTKPAEFSRALKRANIKVGQVAGA